jgi:hypothetical protein
LGGKVREGESTDLKKTIVGWESEVNQRRQQLRRKGQLDATDSIVMRCEVRTRTKDAKEDLRSACKAARWDRSSLDRNPVARATRVIERR